MGNFVARQKDEDVNETAPLSFVTLQKRLVKNLQATKHAIVVRDLWKRDTIGAKDELFGGDGVVRK